MRYEKEESSASTKLTYLLIGGGIGAIIALLFAPKAGHELRGDIADATRKGIDKTKETAAQLQDKAANIMKFHAKKLVNFIFLPKKKPLNWLKPLRQKQAN